MHYNASVVHPPRERERFRMSESRDAADTGMLSANVPVWPGNGGILRPGFFFDGPRNSATRQSRF